MTYEMMTSEIQYEGKIFTVRTDGITMPGGTLAKRDVVTKDNAVAIVAIDDEGDVALIKQYRHPMSEKLWELPAGLIDTDEGALATAQRELMEEVGYTASGWRELVTIAASPGFTDERTTIYLAGDLTFEGRPEGLDDEEADLELQWLPIDKALEWVREGKIINAHTVAGILAVMAYSFADSVLAP